MQAPNFLAISIWIGVIQILFDSYVLAHWTRTVRRLGMSPWWYRSLWIVALVCTLVYWYVVYRRNLYRLEGLNVLLFAITSLWTLPKIAIVPILLVKDFSRVVSAVLKRRPKGGVSPTGGPLDGGSTVANPERRALLSKSAWALTVLPYGIVGNGMFNTLYDFQVHNVEIELPNLPRAFDGFRIVHISDIHAGSFYDHTPFQEARRIIESLRADAIVITGDFVNARPHELTVIERELPKLRAPEGVYGVPGNHDHYNAKAEYESIVRVLNDWGVQMLVNKQQRFSIGSERLVLAGTDNTGFRQSFGKLDLALKGVEQDDAVILLAHDPTFFDRGVKESAVGLMLSGHTHGGQFGVSMLGYEWSPAQYVYRHWAGLYREGSQQIYVNRGLGTVGPPIRIGIRPEITHITLRRPSYQTRAANSA